MTEIVQSRFGWKYSRSSGPKTPAAIGSDQSRTYRAVATSFAQWWLVICLTLLSMLAMIDKNVIALTVLPIQKDLGISRTEIGLAIGAAFAVGNLGFGTAAGWMADRFNRRAVIAVAVIIWSVMAASCGLAVGFATLFVARIGVGVSESLIPPSAYSLIYDGVAEERRGRAFGLYAMSGLLGTGLAFLLGGVLMQLISNGLLADTPLLAARAPWSSALILSGLLGLPLVLLLASFAEPARHSQGLARGTTYADVFRICRAERAIFLPLALFSITQAMLAQSLQTWVPAIVALRFQLSPAQIGPTLGLLLMILGPTGLSFAGFAMDRFERRQVPGAAAVAVLFAILLLAVVPFHSLARTPFQFWVLQGAILLAISTYLAVTATIVAQIAPSQSIGKLMALFLVGQGLLGAGLAPGLTGFVSDHLFAGAAMPLAVGMSVVHAVLALASLASAVVLFVRCRARRRYMTCEARPSVAPDTQCFHGIARRSEPLSRTISCPTPIRSTDSCFLKS
jgi:MFS transporter, Spinster family, sphingosine-1-phosphate transporter